MKIIDTAGSAMWRIQQRSVVTRATGRVTHSVLDDKLRDFHRQMTATKNPDDSGYYAAGRAMIQRYERGFAEIRDFSRSYTSGIQNARMTDAQIEDLIERMNITPR